MVEIERKSDARIVGRGGSKTRPHENKFALCQPNLKRCPLLSPEGEGAGG